MKKLKKLIEPIWIMVSIISTIVTGIINCILEYFDDNKVCSFIFFLIFILSISTIIIQILIVVMENNEIIKHKHKHNVRNIYSPGESEPARAQLEKMINENKNIKKILIICYGTSGYGDIIEKFEDNYAEDLELDVMFCSPEFVYKNSGRDRNEIIRRINNLSKNKNKNVKIYLSKQLCTYRGCLIYDKNDNVIWSCLQTYTFHESQLAYNAAYKETSYTIIGDKNDKFLLKNNKKIILKAFNDMKEEYNEQYSK